MKPLIDLLLIAYAQSTLQGAQTGKGGPIFIKQCSVGKTFILTSIWILLQQWSPATYDRKEIA